jgi:quinoprotein dehydrogenase-associated probable ABC transporter substrate-binding protein
MRSRFLNTLLAFSFLGATARIYAAEDVLRVCADPNNLPFSNAQEQGFENKIASLLASTLHETLSYTWWVERNSLAKNTVNANRCDVLLGVPAAFEHVATTKPYYRSTYVFVYRQDRQLHLKSLYDPALERLHIGVHMLGNGFCPPEVVLARRGIRSNVTGYSMRGSYGQANPPARLIEAVEKKDVDVAIVWGPLGGYFAQQQPAPLVVVPVSPDHLGEVPFSYDIALAVRTRNVALKDRLDNALTSKAKEIRAILVSYGVPESETTKE